MGIAPKYRLGRGRARWSSLESYKEAPAEDEESL